MRVEPHIEASEDVVRLISEDQYKDLTLGDLEDLVHRARLWGMTSRSEVRISYNANRLRDEVIVRAPAGNQ